MNFQDYKKFVLNYMPFEWEINEIDFRDSMRNKHSFIEGFIRFYKVSLYLENIKTILCKILKFIALLLECVLYGSLQ